MQKNAAAFQPVRPVTLAGRHVRLEPLTLSHLDALAAVAYDASLWRWTNDRVVDRASLALYVHEALAAQERGGALPFAAVLIDGDRVVGSTRFLNIVPRDSRVEIGATWIAAPFQRSPVNTEAKLLMLRHAFDTLGAVRVELKTHSLNEKSRAAIERIGARFEGIHRKHMLMPDGTRRDTAWYSILDDEWPAVKADLEYRMEER